MTSCIRKQPSRTMPEQEVDVLFGESCDFCPIFRGNNSSPAITILGPKVCHAFWFFMDCIISGGIYDPETALGKLRKVLNTETAMDALQNRFLKGLRD